MEWKETLRYGGPEARRIHDAAFPHAPLEPGRNIRIRMEEEVSECCEKWRGKYVVPTDSLEIERVRFCPTCGKRL